MSLVNNDDQINRIVHIQYVCTLVHAMLIYNLNDVAKKLVLFKIDLKENMFKSSLL